MSVVRIAPVARTIPPRTRAPSCPTRPPGAGRRRWRERGRGGSPRSHDAGCRRRSLRSRAVGDRDCLVCRELTGDVDVPGGFLWEDEVAVAFHLPPLEENPRPVPRALPGRDAAARRPPRGPGRRRGGGGRSGVSRRRGGAPARRCRARPHGGDRPGRRPLPPAPLPALSRCSARDLVDGRSTSCPTPRTAAPTRSPRSRPGCVPTCDRPGTAPGDPDLQRRLARLAGAAAAPAASDPRLVPRSAARPEERRHLPHRRRRRASATTGRSAARRRTGRTASTRSRAAASRAATPPGQRRRWSRIGHFGYGHIDPIVRAGRTSSAGQHIGWTCQGTGTST